MTAFLGLTWLDAGNVQPDAATEVVSSVLVLLFTLGAALRAGWSQPGQRVFVRAGGWFPVAMWMLVILLMGIAGYQGTRFPGTVWAGVWLLVFVVPPLAAAVLTFCWRDVYLRGDAEAADGLSRSPVPNGLMRTPLAAAVLAAIPPALGLASWDQWGMIAFACLVLVVLVVDERDPRNAAGGPRRERP